MKIGYISPTDPFTDRKAWSGTHYNVCQSLITAGHDVEWIRYSIRSPRVRASAKLLKNIVFDVNLTKEIGRAKVGSITKDLSDYDVIFIPAQSDIVSALKTSTPLVHYSDATVHVMLDYYWHGLSSFQKKIAEKVEQKAIDNTTLNIYSSHWAANSAIMDYHADPDKVIVLPFGANIDDSEIIPADPYKGGTLNVLFSGVDWERKGGQIAVDTVRVLNERGIKSKLTICGIKDLSPQISCLPFINNIGFLDKNDPNQYKKYMSIWQNTNVFILPTRAECSAIVLNEASAYGVPTLTTDTGGLADYVINDVNGNRLPLSAPGEKYADVIETWVDKKMFDSLSNGARQVYASSNSWTAWQQEFNKAIEKIGLK